MIRQKIAVFTSVQVKNSSGRVKPEQQQQWLEALRELAQQRGYKRGWAKRVHQARLAKRHGI